MLKKLISITGVSGYEENVTGYISELIKDKVDSLEVDAIGNLIALKKGNGKDKKKILVAAHCDEIGVQVIKITSEGFAKVRSVGGVSAVSSFMQRVEFENGVTGVISNFGDHGKIDARDFKKVYVDFGLNKKEDTEKLIDIGDVGAFKGEFIELTNNRVMAKALDNRIGCYILIKAIEEMETPYHDVYFTFTVQEEVGLRGAKTVSERIKPSLGIAVDITGSFDVAGDLEGNAVIGGGAAIKVADASVMCDRKLVKEMIDTAKEKNIKYQLDVMSGGGTDAGAINQSNYGVKCVGISIPTRYGHSPSSIVSMKDVEDCTKLLSEYTSKALKLL